MSLILTDGTTLTGLARLISDLDGNEALLLEADQDRGLKKFGVAVPLDRIAGITEQKLPRGVPAPDFLLLIPAAEKAGLEVTETRLREGGLDPGSAWVRSEPIHFSQDTWLYLDSNAISLRSGGITSIGFGIPIASASIGWERKLFSRARGFLKDHVTDIGAHCAARHSDLALNGHVRFFNVSNVQPSSDGGPLLELEGSLWTAAAVHPSWSEGRADDPWALCYFRQDCMMVGSGSWEHMHQPVRIYGDKQPQAQTLNLGVAHCYLKARAAMCFAGEDPVLVRRP